tara:strand:- start:3288 stop:3551 length:264 start_codon:yes stop_codon:yes gene_type:complete
MTPSSKVKAIEGLTKSTGWNVLKQCMEEEILQAAMAIAESSTMHLDEINFRRGSIWAAKTMLDLPERLRMKLEAETALAPKDDKSSL